MQKNCGTRAFLGGGGGVSFSEANMGTVGMEQEGQSNIHKLKR